VRVERVEPASIGLPGFAAAPGGVRSFDDDALTEVGGAPSMAKRRALSSRSDDEEQTVVRGMPTIDPDLGDDLPTESELLVPDLDRAEATGGVALADSQRIPLVGGARARGAGREARPPLPIPPPPAAAPSPSSMGSASSSAITGRVPLVGGDSGVVVPIQAPATGRVPLVEPKAQPPAKAPPSSRGTSPGKTPSGAPGKVPLATPVPPSRPGAVTLRAEELDAIDPAASVDTPLPPAFDPLADDTTGGYPLAEPLRQHIYGAAKRARSEAEPGLDLGDPMAKTIPMIIEAAERAQRAARSQAAKSGRGTGPSRAVAVPGPLPPAAGAPSAQPGANGPAAAATAVAVAGKPPLVGLGANPRGSGTSIPAAKLSDVIEGPIRIRRSEISWTIVGLVAILIVLIVLFLAR